jgi:hypothetical protein
MSILFTFFTLSIYRNLNNVNLTNRTLIFVRELYVHRPKQFLHNLIRYMHFRMYPIHVLAYKIITIDRRRFIYKPNA